MGIWGRRTTAAGICDFDSRFTYEKIHPQYPRWGVRSTFSVQCGIFSVPGL